MFSLLSILHTRQIWLLLVIAAIGVFFMTARPVSVDSPSVPEGDYFSAEKNLTNSIAFERLNEKLQGSVFYTEIPTEERQDPLGSSANLSLTATGADPILRAIAGSDGKRTAYFAVGVEIVTVNEGDSLIDWLITEIDASSVQFVKDDQSRRMYMYDRLLNDVD